MEGVCAECVDVGVSLTLVALGSVMVLSFVIYLVRQQVLTRTLATRIKRRKSVLKTFITFLQYNSFLLGFKVAVRCVWAPSPR